MPYVKPREWYNERDRKGREPLAGPSPHRTEVRHGYPEAYYRRTILVESGPKRRSYRLLAMDGPPSLEGLR